MANKQKYTLSKTEIKNEIIKCGKDASYFIDNYCKISTVGRGLVSFRTYDFQKDLLDDFNNYPNNIILKSRQLGVSTLSGAYCVWLMLFHREKTIMVVSTKHKVAANLVKKVKTIMKHLPPWFTQLANISVDNRTSFCLSNGSQIEAGSKAIDVGRSEALSLLILDEAAHIPNMDEIWMAAAPTMSTGGRCIVISSPNGQGNWFHNKYIKAEPGENEFHPTKLMWWEHPDRDEAWEIEERKKYSKKQFAQEFECDFLTSGDTVVDVVALQKIFKGLEQPIATGGIDGNLWIWERYNNLYNYLIVSDVARGDGNDFSSIQVMCLETFTQVAEYKGKIEYDIFSEILNQVALEYGAGMLVVENNMIGFEVAKKLISYEYPNLFYSEKGTHEYVAPFDVHRKNNVIPGFTTSKTTRPWIINKLEDFTRNDLIHLKSERSYNELTTFIWSNGKAEAARGHNDDLVMPLAIACWVRETALIEMGRGIEYKKSLLSSIMVRRSDFNTHIPGEVGYNPKTSVFTKQIAKDKERYYGFGIMKG